MITPYVEGVVSTVDGKKVISYGVSSYGYDIRLANEFVLFKSSDVTNTEPVVIDPKHISEDNCTRIFATKDHFLLPPKTFVLAKSVERLKMPRNVIAECLGKSTYARAAIFVGITPIEPGWEGVITLEIFNTSDSYVKLYINEGICQLVFHDGVEPDVSYADRGGKYQGQQGVTLPKMVETDVLEKKLTLRDIGCELIIEQLAPNMRWLSRESPFVYRTELRSKFFEVVNGLKGIYRDFELLDDEQQFNDLETVLNLLRIKSDAVSAKMLAVMLSECEDFKQLWFRLR